MSALATSENVNSLKHLEGTTRFARCDRPLSSGALKHLGAEQVPIQTDRGHAEAPGVVLHLSPGNLSLTPIFCA